MSSQCGKHKANMSSPALNDIYPISITGIGNITVEIDQHTVFNDKILEQPHIYCPKKCYIPIISNQHKFSDKSWNKLSFSFEAIKKVLKIKFNIKLNSLKKNMQIKIKEKGKTFYSIQVPGR
jgi:hypothetical protein